MTQNERISIPIWKRIIILVITLLVFAIQIMLFVFAFQLTYSEVNKIVYFLIEALAILLVIYIIHKPMITSYKLTWSILILVLPLPFSLLYYLNSFSKRLPKRKQNKFERNIHKIEYNEEQLKTLNNINYSLRKHVMVLQQNNNFEAFNDTKYTYFNDAELKHIDFMEELKKAQKYIFIETFIISEGYLLDQLFEILKQKGEEGIEIKIIYDDLGSKRNLRSKTIKEIAKIPNCKIVNYNPLGLNINPAFNYRNHRKISIIDGKIAYCGGDNLADEYIHKIERFGYWRDTCGKFEGQAVKGFIKLFIETWFLSTKELLDVDKYICQNNVIRADSFIVPFGDGPTDNANIGYDLFKSLINNAKKSLYISTPYFVIDDDMIEAIVLAIKSGVDVKILMPAIPDKKSAFYLGRYNYKKILKVGGKIYEYTKGFNHAKNIISDNDAAFIGTLNMDFRSMFLHYECGALIIKDEEINKMKEDFLRVCNESEEITYEKWKKRPFIQKIIAYIFYLFAPMF